MIRQAWELIGIEKMAMAKLGLARIGSAKE